MSLPGSKCTKSPTLNTVETFHHKLTSDHGALSSLAMSRFSCILWEDKGRLKKFLTLLTFGGDDDSQNYQRYDLL